MATIEIKGKKAGMPCIRTQEELRTRARQVIADYERGDATKFVAHEDVEKRIKSWNAK